MFVRETGGINRQQWEKLCRHTQPQITSNPIKRSNVITFGIRNHPSGCLSEAPEAGGQPAGFVYMLATKQK